MDREREGLAVVVEAIARRPAVPDTLFVVASEMSNSRTGFGH